ncbi:ROK family transcriptional regulator [Paenibacillus sp. J2TS4]|uniref:ROK family transcriptional regulator n=1 Tax=Paenibacillus sp. J2TS4 TaxID=2807194 RepID=UPI001B1D2C50|nr:ROK family transcriptional regulator [Paenibacillus sp. J2TS4]GIP31735.1 xylose repressor [Paenibacillus sp. J2TS4]
MVKFAKAGDQKFLQTLNRTLVLNTIHHFKTISRIDIAKKTKLSQSTVSNVVDALEKEGYIAEVGTGNSTRAGGRRPTLLTINAAGGYIATLAVVTEAFHITLQVCLFDLHLTMVDEQEIEVKEKGAELIETIKACVHSFLQKHADKNVIGLGFSMPTVLDRTGVVYRGHLLELEDYPFEEEMRKAFPSLFLVVEQEQHAAILGERAIGPAKDVNNLIYVTVGRGIGSSVIVNNELIRGEYGGAGEIGHMSINKYGPKCICGKKGCLRLYATELAFINKINEAAQNGFPLPPKIYNPVLDQCNIREVYNQAVAGDEFCREMLVSLLDDLSIGLSNLIYLINPKMIIIGGNLLFAEPFVLPYITDKLKEIMDSPTADIQIVGAALGNKSSVYGMASLILDKHFLKKELMFHSA